ncbi:aminoglycoside phosphotransferase family protein [Brachybacterium sp. NBEC-018]|uniref:aminoglycoside phosphotransferase family protein n=1 Tax=Brachybacterium sp. NBEC-018 TaxID=2996004 RepID=UPI00217559B6|nr:aminoglycoside phosphotransferase family protein [Brachybacterium sp. NBEC-018]UVY84392.1 aminoglycoside phosphotransferase family protein [Brachybacterium sp. NBEC-018]
MSPSELLVLGRPLPPLLAENTHSGVAAWREALPTLVPAVLEEWSLSAGVPYAPGGSASWVAPVRDVEGRRLTLKVTMSHDEARDEAAGMAAWQGHGAATVLRSEQRGSTTLLLMEEVRPGTPLAELPDPEVQDEVFAALVTRLHVPAPTGGPFRPLADMCEWWADEAQERLDRMAGLLPAHLAAHGLRLFRELPRQWDGTPVLLATDLHPHNILRRERGGTGEDGDWVLIDPKPYVGDPHYDLLQYLLNHEQRLLRDPSGLVRDLAQRTGLDPHRARDWAFARCVQEAGEMDSAAEIALRLAEEGAG